MPYGGKYQLTPTMAMAAKLPVDGETTTCSGMAWGFNPYLTEADPYRGAFMAVVESVTKMVCAGFRHKDLYLTFQEYFEHMGAQPERWGKPLAALLGALDAQMGLGIASIGGKDSMSGSFEGLDVPPTLVSFATGIGDTRSVVSAEFKKANSAVVVLKPQYKNGLPTISSLLANYFIAEQMIAEGKVAGRRHAGLRRHCRGAVQDVRGQPCGPGAERQGDHAGAVQPLLRRPSFWNCWTPPPASFWALPPWITPSPSGDQAADMERLQDLWEAKLEPVFPYRGKGDAVEALDLPVPEPCGPRGAAGHAESDHPGVPRHQLRVRHRPRLPPRRRRPAGAGFEEPDPPPMWPRAARRWSRPSTRRRS